MSEPSTFLSRRLSDRPTDDGYGTNVPADVDLIAALRTVADRIAGRPWTASVESAFRELADELSPPAPDPSVQP